jgi:hypothetical protein
MGGRETSGRLGTRCVLALPGARAPSGGGAWSRCRFLNRRRVRRRRRGPSRRGAVGAAEAELLEAWRDRLEAPGRGPHEVSGHVDPGDQARHGGTHAADDWVAQRVIVPVRACGLSHGLAGRYSARPGLWPLARPRGSARRVSDAVKHKRASVVCNDVAVGGQSPLAGPAGGRRRWGKGGERDLRASRGVMHPGAAGSSLTEQGWRLVPVPVLAPGADSGTGSGAAAWGRAGAGQSVPRKRNCTSPGGTAGKLPGAGPMKSLAMSTQAIGHAMAERMSPTTGWRGEL